MRRYDEFMRELDEVLGQPEPGPVEPRPVMTPALEDARQDAVEAGFGDVVRFDEPPQPNLFQRLAGRFFR